MLDALRAGQSASRPAPPGPVSSAHSARRFASVSGWGASLHLTPEQRDFQALASDFARGRLEPHAAGWDARGEFPVAALREAAGLGFGGVYTPEDLGGSGLSRADGAVIFEALAYGDVPFAAYLTIHNMVSGIINRHGSEAVRSRYLPRLASMELLAAYCLTEPGSGSDAAAMRTVATPADGGWLISGSKAFISGGGVADVYVVMARTATGDAGGGGGGAGGGGIELGLGVPPPPPAAVSAAAAAGGGESAKAGGGGGGKGGGGGISAFIVEKGSPGLSFGPPERKMGWRMQPTCAVSFDRVFVPSGQLLGRQGEGFKIAMAALDGGRVNIAACSVGGAARALDAAAAYAGERSQFGQAVASFQASQFKLADMATRLAASRLLVASAARALDAAAPEATTAAAMAKRFATDECFAVALDAQQLLGGYGYLCDFPLERIVRDLRVHSILEGTNEVMRLVISRQLQRAAAS
ncbi:hypothetical protein Rsub_12662 [Raphidocelis subcapitata]|uniref:Acyl-CoA dehydrogenase n=1 Tax=Raphidocelis subcapitata TaxID=307507 RepID=A0A2V0PKA0_9CHLO|nr:hypothetical protein Rsub_12662 [Raphidocelis subcapitata]|eukprot:GBF99969.1 hypothetical protein Rsub_12662 [Raphidocelis subcapitata]